jgi:hypothetical protein
MKTYRGHVTPEDGMDWSVTVDGGDLKPRNDLADHSDGVSWGYFGSGAAQLALAILADHTGNDKKALSLHQDFVSALISKLPKEECWQLTSNDIELALNRIELRLLRAFVADIQKRGALAEDTDELLFITDRAADMMRLLRIPGKIYSQEHGAEEVIETIE